MSIILTWIKNRLSWLFIGLAVILLNLSIGFNNFEYVVYFIYALLGGLVISLIFFNKKSFFLLMVFLIPLSFPIKLGSGNVLSFPSEVLVGFLGLFVLLRMLLKTQIERRILYHPLTILILLDLLWMVVCSIYSSIPEYSLKRTLVRILYVSVYFFIALELFKNKRNMWLVFIFYIVGVVYPIIHSMLFHAKISFASQGSYQMTQPFFADHTIYGACLAFLVPIIFSFAINRKVFEIPKKYGILLWVLSFFILIAAVLSYSRAAWIGLVVAALVAVLVLFRTRFYVLLIGLGVFTAIVLLNFETISESAKRSDAKSNSASISQHVESVSNIQSDASNTERINRWKCALRMFNDRPVFGFGPGTYQFNYGKYQVKSEMTHISTYTGNRGHAHSEYLTYLSEEGMPGIIIFSLLVLFSIFVAFRVIYKSNDIFARRMAISVLLGLVTFYVHGFFNAFLDLDKMSMLIFTSLAILVRLDNGIWNIDISQFPGSLNNSESGRK